jgi:hypothetical protein
MSGAFASAALDLHSYGLAVLPTGGNDGKVPLLKNWRRWKGQGRRSVQELADKFPDANVGIITGQSGLTVVDADDEKALADSESRFGVSPLVVRTPRGGGHLYFRSTGEKNANLRREGLNADIRGDGGMILAPPSVRSGVGVYRIERGSWSDLDSLPFAAVVERGQRTAAIDPRRPAGCVPAPSPAPKEGARNDTLYRALRFYAEHCDTLEAMLREADALNKEFIPPLPSSEVSRCARSVWRMKTEGRILLPGQQRILTTPAELDRLSADGLYFLMSLRRWHGAKHGEPFALVAKAMARDESLRGWGSRRIRAATRELLGSGDLVLIRKGGSRKGDPSYFRLGCSNVTQYNSTPALRLSAGVKAVELSLIQGGKE